jgi:hypothetical protein
MKKMEPLKSVDEIIERYAVVSSPIKSRVYIGLGYLFVVFAIAGIWIPGWPTISWAVPAAFLFSLSSERLFRWSLTNPYFGAALYQYYANGKTLPLHVKWLVSVCILLMTGFSAYGVFWVSYPADPGYGAATIAFLGVLGVGYIFAVVRTRR